jgi:hypothetical protein
VGQRGDLTTSKVAPVDIAKVRRSEVAHSLYQALSRGSCRLVENGQAKPMRGWFMMRDEKVVELLREAMPGVKVQNWTPAVVDLRQGKAEKLAALISATLNAFPPTRHAVSTRELKRAILGDEKVPSMTWTRALRQVVDEEGSAWRIRGRSVERTAAVLFPDTYARKVTQDFAANF